MNSKFINSTTIYVGVAGIVFLRTQWRRQSWYRRYVEDGGYATRQNFTIWNLITSVLYGLGWPVIILSQLYRGILTKSYDELDNNYRESIIEEFNGFHRLVVRLSIQIN